jgi:hypothetical protein
LNTDVAKTYSSFSPLLNVVHAPDFISRKTGFR